MEGPSSRRQRAAEQQRVQRVQREPTSSVETVRNACARLFGSRRLSAQYSGALARLPGPSSWRACDEPVPTTSCSSCAWNAFRKDFACRSLMNVTAITPATAAASEHVNTNALSLSLICECLPQYSTRATGAYGQASR